MFWVREVLGMTPTDWQETFLRAPRGASIPCSDRATGWQDHHGRRGHRTFDAVYAGFVIRDCLPAQRQSAEAVRQSAREACIKAGAELATTMSTGSN